MNDLKEQGKRALAWDFFGKISAQGMGFAVTIVLARLLEPSDFGLIAMVMVIVGIANVFTDVGLSGALIQRKRVLPVHYSSVFYFNMLIGLLLMLLTYFSAGAISEFYDSRDLKPLVEVMSMAFLLGALMSVQNTRLRKELNYSKLTRISLAASFTSGLVGIFLAFQGAGVWSLVAQVLSMLLMQNLLVWARGNWVPGLEFSWKALLQLWGFGFRMFLSRMLNEVFSRLDYLLIGKLFPAATLGYYQRAKSLNNMVLKYSSGSLMAVLFPVLSKLKNDLPRFQNVVLKSLGILVFVVFFFLGNLYLVSNELIVLLFSDKWLPSVGLFELLVLTAYAPPMGALLANVLASRGNSKAFLRLEVYKKLYAVANFVVLYNWGMHAYLYGMIVGSVVRTVLNIVFVSREMSLRQLVFWRPILIQMAISIVSVVLTKILTDGIHYGSFIDLVIKNGFFSLLYVLINYFFKVDSYIFFLDQARPVLLRKLSRSKG